MVTRIFREYIWTLMVAAASEDVYDVSAIMQDIAPRKGFKILGITAQVNTTDVAAADSSVAYINFLKNISEAGHHLQPAVGEMSDIRKDGVIDSIGMIFYTNDAYRYFERPHYSKPIVFDANDRLNVELTFNNKDAAQAFAVFRVFLDVEIA